MNLENKRKPHAVLDLDSRKLKALKIELLLGLRDKKEKLTLLDIGTGSGGVANYFAMLKTKKYDVDSVDVFDSRKIHEGYRFHLVTGCDLPFEDQSFDIVITNHVIEHVGSYENQIVHLQEIRRVLKKNGVGYLAVPNRWMIEEPHYKLLFLSWLPKRFRTPYLKLMKKGEFYDCEPLTVSEVERMFDKIGFEYENKCIEAFRYFLVLEKPKSFYTKILNRVPNFIFRPLIKLIPTLIYVFK